MVGQGAKATLKRRSSRRGARGSVAEETGRAMDFQILGSLEVRRDGRPVLLRAAKQRALLAILLLHAGEVVGRDRLIDGLWADGPPETAAHALQVYVAQLRRALEPGRVRGAPHEILLTHPAGYLARVEPGRLDAQRFERLLGE